MRLLIRQDGFKGNYRNDGRTISRRQIYFSASHGEKARYSPDYYHFIILTAGNLFGIMGIILAIPGYAILKVLVTHGYRFVKLNT